MDYFLGRLLKPLPPRRKHDGRNYDNCLVPETERQRKLLRQFCDERGAKSEKEVVLIVVLFNCFSFYWMVLDFYVFLFFLRFILGDFSAIWPY